MLDAGLDQLEQAHCIVGQYRHRAIGSGNRLAAGVQPLGDYFNLAGQLVFDVSTLFGQRRDLPGELVELHSDLGLAVLDCIQLLALHRPLACGCCIKARHLPRELIDKFLVAQVEFVAPLDQLFGKYAVAFGQSFVHLPGFFGEFGQSRTGGFHCLAINLADLRDRAAQVLFQLGDRRLPGFHRAAFAVTQRADQAGTFIAHRTKPGAKRSQAFGLMRIEHGTRCNQFFGQGCGTAAHRRQRDHLMRVELSPDGIAAGVDLGEPLVGDLAHLIGLTGKFSDGLTDQITQRFDLALARLTKVVEFLEPAHQFGYLRMRTASGCGDVVAHVLGRAGDHRELTAQLLHIFKRRRADIADRIDPRAVIVDEFGEALGVLRQPLGSDTAKRINITRLRSDELTRQTQLAVNCGQTDFQRSRGIAQQLGSGSKSGSLSPAVAHRDQPQHRHQQYRHRPITQPARPLRG